MSRILFFHTQTLHSKVTIPLALKLIARGFEVYYLKNRPDFLKFSIKNIVKSPISVSFMNRNSLRYVAQQINYFEEFEKRSIHFNTTFIRNFGRYDAVIATTKNMPELKKINQELGIPCFALGYQHLPLLVRVGRKFQSQRDECKDSIFLRENAFTKDHGFMELFDNETGIIHNNFTYLDKVYTCFKAWKTPEGNNSVLIFHPGGYRMVLTEPGASRKISYERQRDFIIKVCLPLLESGFKPVIKIHPLHARYHGFNDLKVIATDVEQTYNLKPETINITDVWFWEQAFKAAFILTFGSSSIYELWAAGIKKVYIGNFFGHARSKRFSYFRGIYINTYSEYEDFIKNRRFEEPVFDKFTLQVIDAYAGLFDGSATSRAAEIIRAELSGNLSQ